MSARAFFQPWPALCKGWGWSFLVCGLAALAAASQFAWTDPASGGAALETVARDWLPWAVALPLLFRLVARLPLERPHWRRAVLIHGLCAVAVVALAEGWEELVLPPHLSHEHRHPPPSANAGDNGAKHPDPHHDVRHWVGGILFFKLPIYLAVVSVAHAIHFYRRSVAREHSLGQAHLAALKMQLQPHFLFNSLNAVVALIHLNPAAAEEMIIALSSLLRLSLETSGEQLLPLGKELEFVRGYFDIERARFGDRLSFTLDVPADTHAALVPAFVLQPLVENAVRHGLEPRVGPGSLTVSARREGARLRLTVSDDGVGLPTEKPWREGVGLSNTRDRLHALFDGAATLELLPGRGLTVHISLPFRTAA